MSPPLGELQLRPPLAATWRLDASAKDLAMFATAVTLLALAWVAARTFEILHDPVHFTVLTVLVLVAGVSLHHVIMALAVSYRRTQIMIRIAVAMMLIGWAALMTGQFANVAFFDQARVTINPPSWFQAWPTLEFSLLTALQVFIVVTGLVLALISLGQVNFRGSSLWTRIGRRAVPIVFMAYSATVLILLLR